LSYSFAAVFVPPFARLTIRLPLGSWPRLAVAIKRASPHVVVLRELGEHGVRILK
jgi:hypothetical protein